LVQSPDIVIVGAGATGLSFAWRLVKQRPDLEILVLERGGYIDQRHGPSLSDDWELALQRQFHANPNVRRNTADYPVDETATPIKPAFFNAVGGSTIRWGAHFPRFRPSDFEVQSLDGVAADWPISYKTLVPYMDINDSIMGVSGLAGDPGNPPRKERPHPPLGSCTGSLRLAKAANRLGWHWWPADAAINSTDSEPGRDGCNNCGPCGMGCPRHARASADIAYLARAQEAGVKLSTHKVVRKIITKGGAATGVETINSDGRTEEISCKELVLAGNAISTNVLLTTMSDWENPLLGRGLMLHPTAIVTGFFAEDLKSYSGPFATSIISQEFYETDPKRQFLRGFQLQALRGQGPLSTALGGYGQRLNWGGGHASAFADAFGKSMSLTVTCEDLPEPDNRIEVNTKRQDQFGMPIAKMCYRLGANTRRIRDYGVERASEWLRTAGAERLIVTPLSVQAGFHIMGTASMGSEARSSVTGHDGRVHGIDNLTVIDASVFVTASPVNPTSTLQALALRAADLMGCRLAQT
jgi:choline dehydrogenase-like flavoprotein